MGPNESSRDALDVVWVLLGTCFVLLMQLGLALLEAGANGQTNSQQPLTMLKVFVSDGRLALVTSTAMLIGQQVANSHACNNSTRLQNLSNTLVASMTWLSVGFGVFAASGSSLFGTNDVFFAAFATDDTAASVAVLTAMAASLASAIPSGALSSRVDARAFALLSSLSAALLFPVAARSVWHPRGAPRPLPPTPRCKRPHWRESPGMIVNNRASDSK